MNFNSLTYLIYFPLVFILHWLLPHRMRRWMLLIASWAFYFWWNWGTGFLLVGSTVVSWLCARGIQNSSNPCRRKVLLILTLTASLGCLAVFKYADFFLSTAGWSLSFSILLPVGISFYTFQTLSYVIDVYRSTVSAEPDFFHYALFVSFFPQLVAGPIERPENLLPQLKNERQFRFENLRVGIWFLLRGYFKKILVADSIAPLIDPVFLDPAAAFGPEILLSAMLFGIQIYCDFSGYSDIARGSAKLLGIDLMENFRIPYRARTIRDFWRRWHISLTSWFTDYVYIPLGGSRNGLPRRIRNILVVFLLSGLWHGADWSFVVWGGLHGLFQVAGILWDRRKHKFFVPGWIQRLRTFGLVSFCWIFFRAESLSDSGLLLSRLATGWGNALRLDLTVETLALLGLSFACLHFLDLVTPGKFRSRAHALAACFFLITAICIGWLIVLSANGQNAFIYFQF